MAEISREGHRQRAKELYIDSPSSVADHNLLELLLFYSIPRKDVKPIAYNLINHFGSIENVFDASIDELMKVDGVGEATAVLINLNKTIRQRIEKNKNNDIKAFNNYNDSIIYAENILKTESIEKFLIITLDNKGKIIKHHIVATGSVNHVLVEPSDVVKYAINDNASAVIIAHNHPKGDCYPSAADESLTIDILGLLRKFHINLNDHIIVGEKRTKGMSTMIGYSNYFDE